MKRITQSIRLRWRGRHPGWLKRAVTDPDTWKTASLLVLAASAVMTLVFVLPALYRTKDDASAGRRAAEEVRRGNDDASCRGSYSGAVTDARAGLDDAIAALDDARANLDSAQAAQQQAFVDLGVAAVAQDGTGYRAAQVSIGDTAMLVGAVQAQVDAARLGVSSGRDGLLAARQTFQRLLDAPPILFRAMCAAGPPG